MRLHRIYNQKSIAEHAVFALRLRSKRNQLINKTPKRIENDTDKGCEIRESMARWFLFLLLVRPLSAGQDITINTTPSTIFIRHLRRQTKNIYQFSNATVLETNTSARSSTKQLSACFPFWCLSFLIFHSAFLLSGDCGCLCYIFHCLTFRRKKKCGVNF